MSVCPSCKDFGIVHIQPPDLRGEHRIERCSCEEGRPRWISLETGAECPPLHKDAYLYNSDEHIARWNRAINCKWARGGRAAKIISITQGEKREQHDDKLEMSTV